VVDFGLLFEKVRPANTYAYRVKRCGGKVAIFNVESGGVEDYVGFIFWGPCEIQLPLVFPELSASPAINEAVNSKPSSNT
jgi:hypothetical protein